MTGAGRHLAHVHVHADDLAVIHPRGQFDIVRHHRIPLAAAFQDACLFGLPIGVRIPALAAEFAPADFRNVQLMIDDLDMVGERKAVAIVEAAAKGGFTHRARLIVEESLSGIGLVFQHVPDRCERQLAEPRETMAKLREFFPERVKRGRTRLRLDAVRGFKTSIELIRRQPFGQEVIPHETTRPGKAVELLGPSARHRQQPVGDVAMHTRHARLASRIWFNHA